MSANESPFSRSFGGNASRRRANPADISLASTPGVRSGSIMSPQTPRTDTASSSFSPFLARNSPGKGGTGSTGELGATGAGAAGTSRGIGSLYPSHISPARVSPPKPLYSSPIRNGQVISKSPRSGQFSPLVSTPKTHQTSYSVTPPPNASRATSTPGERPTGSWVHPGLEEISRKSVNKEMSVQKVLYNVGYLIIIGLISRYHDTLPSMGQWTAHHQVLLHYLSYLYRILQIIFGYNVISNILLVIKPHPRFDNLPMTPSQREKFGLPSSPSTSGSIVSPTPPKYLRSSPQLGLATSTPRQSPSISQSQSAQKPSPLAQRDSKPIVRLQSSGTSGSATSSPTDRLAVSPGTPFSPTGKYKYLAETPSRTRI